MVFVHGIHRQKEYCVVFINVDRPTDTHYSGASAREDQEADRTVRCDVNFVLE